MAGTRIPPNLFRKKSRALIDSAWASGNRKQDAAGAEVERASPEQSDRRAEIVKKSEEIAARRTRRRALRI